MWKKVKVNCKWKLKKEYKVKGSGRAICKNMLNLTYEAKSKSIFYVKVVSMLPASVPCIQCS